jgi:hypothetical protein
MLICGKTHNRKTPASAAGLLPVFDGPARYLPETQA